MKHTLLAVSVALFFLFSGFTGFPAVMTVAPALAQGGDVLVQDGLWLPRSHRYELYNPENAAYGPVPVDTVSSYVRQGRWIYDRTAEAWVSHPSVGQPNPQFVAAGRDSRREAWADHEVLIQDGLRLPRAHRYELYNPENAVYGAVPVDTVSSYVRQGRWIYDRTAEAWVSHPSVGTPNPQFVASGREVHPQSRREELLGQLEVDLRRDRDVIEVPRDEGGFQKIRVVVRGASIQLRDMKVTFADDSVFDAAGRDRILQEDSAYVFDLPGDRRMIKRITFLYRSIDRREGKATVSVYGER